MLDRKKMKKKTQSIKSSEKSKMTFVWIAMLASYWTDTHDTEFSGSCIVVGACLLYTRSNSVSNQFPNGLFSLSLFLFSSFSFHSTSFALFLTTSLLIFYLSLSVCRGSYGAERESLFLRHIHRNHIDTIRVRQRQCICEHVGWYSRLWRRM